MGERGSNHHNDVIFHIISKDHFASVNLCFSTWSCSLINVRGQLLTHEHREEKPYMQQDEKSVLFWEAGRINLNSPTNVAQKQQTLLTAIPLWMCIWMFARLWYLWQEMFSTINVFLSSSVINLNILSFTTSKSETGCWSWVAKVCVCLWSKHPGTLFLIILNTFLCS